jgi:hypothetical protein
MQGGFDMNHDHQGPMWFAEAVQELQSAWLLFDEATDDDLIEEAIFRIKSAELRIERLARMAKQS